MAYYGFFRQEPDGWERCTSVIVFDPATAAGYTPPDGVTMREITGALSEVGSGWRYNPATDETMPAVPVSSGITRGQFRLLFTFAERQAEAAFKRAAEAAAEAGTATNEQLVYLTMRDDFDSAASINLSDPATIAALDFYVAFGLLTAERRDEVLAGVTPS